MAHPVRFYRALPGTWSPEQPDFGELTLSVWQPRRDGPPRGIFADRTNRAWYAIDRLGLFAREGLAVYAVHDGPRLLHRLLVTRRWYRFPFMARDDLQVGMLWTDPAMRGRGLAQKAMAAVHRDYAGRFDAVWYLVDEDNAASIRLIERIGYPLFGTGVRTRPLGVGTFGRFELNRRCAPERPD